MKNDFMRRFANVALAATLIAPALVEAGSIAEAEVKSSEVIIHKPSMFKLGFENITLPGNESMGMLATTYLIEVTPSLYMGPAAYGAISGRRGGFFTAGAEVAWHRKLAPRLEMQTGVYAGGGGGGAAMVGGGLMIRPHVDILWLFNGYSAGVSASNVRFPNGHINSYQIGVMFSANSDFSYTNTSHVGQSLHNSSRGGVGFDRVIITAGSYKPGNNTINNSGVIDSSDIGYAGFRMERFLSPSMYWGIEAAGAASGKAAGYAEYLGTLGAELPIWDDYFAIGARLASGMGGGGSVSVGGGFLNKLSAYATANLSRNTHLSLEGGYATAPNGNFRAKYGSANFTWDLDHPGASGRGAVIAGNEWAFGLEHYFDAAYNDGSKRDLDAVTIKLNRYLNNSIYLTGQAHSAYRGDSGGYSVGLFGAGYRTQKIFSRLSAGAEMLIGAAGGGGLNTSGGAIMQPMAYLGMDLTDLLGIKLSAGRVKSFKGALNSKVVDLSVNFSFGTSSRR